MKTRLLSILCILLMSIQISTAQERRPIDNKHPLWFIHVDVWYEADPQKIIDLIPEDIRPYVCLNLSLSSSHDEKTSVFRKPQYAFQTLKSWATVCQLNEMWFSCQFSSGGYVHVPDDDMATYEYFFKQFPNFLGWNFAEQFWGFDEPDKASASSEGRWELFARLVEMSHKYGGFLTISWCGQFWHYNTDPIAELKRCPKFFQACKSYPEAILFLFKYTVGEGFYNTESICFGSFISGLTKNYGVRYDICGWDSALNALFGEGHGMSVPGAAGIGTVMEQTCINGAAVWDGPELTWQECFHELEGTTTVDGYQRRNWGHLPDLDGVWIDMFRQILNGNMYIPTREEVVGETKIVVIDDVNSGNDEDLYATWPDLFDGIYNQNDPMNHQRDISYGIGQLGNNYTYFKSTGRYRTIPMVIDLYDDAALQIPVQVKKTEHERVWPTIEKKQQDFNAQYPEVSMGDLYVNRYRNQLVTYTPYTYLNMKTTAEAVIPLQYNTCETLELHYDKLSSGIIREYVDHIDFYLNNFRADSTELRTDIITIKGASSKPTFTTTTHETGTTVVAEVQISEAYVDGTYSLTVKHCGPVSLTINCTGTANHNTVQQTAIPEQPTELPKQPVLYRGPIIIEAEDMDFRSINRYVPNFYDDYPDIRGHSGNGFMDMGNDSNGSLRHDLNLKDGQQGDYHIIMRYTCTTKSGNVTISVNGQQQTVHCKQTNVNEWRTVSIDATLTTGRNTLFINNNDGLPMYIDQVIYQPVDIAPMKYSITVRDAEGGIVSANRSDAVEGDTVTLTIQPAEDYRLDELRVVNSVFYLDDKTFPFDNQHEVTFVMPHDNVTIQPVFKNLPVFSNVVTKYRLNLTDVVTSMPEGWRCVQEDGVVHEYGAEEYGQGARIMEGFTGYQGRALYWRNNRAEYGRQEQYPLMLQKGRYELSFTMAAWKENPHYKVSILSLETGAVVASSETFTAAPNSEGSQTADVSGAELRRLLFDIKHQGKYVISFTDETAEDGFHEFLLLECCLKLALTDLATNLYHEWDGCTATSQIVNEDCGGQVCVGEKLQPGWLVYGDASVFYTHYADLTDYDQLAIVGTPGLQLRVLLNRLEVGNGGGDDNGGAWTELNPIISSDCMAVINLSNYEFVHLNAIKLDWGSPEGAIKSMSLIKGNNAQFVTITADNISMSGIDDVPEIIVRKNKTVTLKATVYPESLEDKTVKWESSDKTIATVSSSGKVKGLRSGIVTINCTSVATGAKATCKVTVGTITLNKSSVTINKGKTVTLKPTVYPETLEDKSVTWKSSDKTIATVTSAGKVKGVKAGTATITCTSNATGLSATCEVTVGGVALDQSEVIVRKKKSVTLKATVYPETLEDKSVKWESSDKTIATVSSSGKVTGVKSGVVTITCTSNATGLSTTCKVTVGTITLDKSEVIVRKKKTVTLTPTVYPTTLEDKSVTWKSSDKEVATVSKDGVVTGVKSGVVTITCTSIATGLSTTCQVTVGTITLNMSSVTITKGESVTLKPTVYPTTLEDKSVTWKSSKTSVATVSSTGEVKGVKAGTATITCTSNATGLSTTCKITVKKASASARTIDGDDTELTDIEIVEVTPAAEEPFDVFDLRGHRVLHQVTSLDGLPAGVYIANGKKVMKR